MSDIKDDLVAVVNGENPNPQIDVNVEGEAVSFNGEDAIMFALGALYGMEIKERELESVDRVLH